MLGTPIGKRGQGILEPIQPAARRGTEGLGYVKNDATRVQLLQRLMPITPSLTHFVSAGFIDPNTSISIESIGKNRLTAEQKQKQVLICHEEDRQGEGSDDIEGLTSLFQDITLTDSQQEQIMVMLTDLSDEDPTELITTAPHPAETNWYLLNLPGDRPESPTN
jgi:hypothetical protein